MKDEEYVFHSECREKKNIARSARNQRTHNGKGGRVKFPSDYMTKKELNKMNGEVKSYRMNDPMTWDEFKALPDDLKVLYIKWIRDKWNAPDCYIARMMGKNTCTFSQTMNALGLSIKDRKSNTKWDKEGFLAWSNGVPVPKTETMVEAKELDCEPCTIPECIMVKEEKKVIPLNGSLTFEGKVEDAMAIVASLMGGENVRVTITWERMVDNG